VVVVDVVNEVFGSITTTSVEVTTNPVLGVMTGYDVIVAPYVLLHVIVVVPSAGPTTYIYVDMEYDKPYETDIAVMIVE